MSLYIALEWESLKWTHRQAYVDMEWYMNVTAYDIQCSNIFLATELLFTQHMYQLITCCYMWITHAIYNKRKCRVLQIFQGTCDILHKRVSCCHQRYRSIFRQFSLNVIFHCGSIFIVNAMIMIIYIYIWSTSILNSPKIMYRVIKFPAANSKYRITWGWQIVTHWSFDPGSVLILILGSSCPSCCNFVIWNKWNKLTILNRFKATHQSSTFKNSV